MEDIKYQLFNAPILRVLDVFLQRPDVELTDFEVQQKVHEVKRSAVHLALVRLANMGVIERRTRDRKCFSSLNFSRSWIAPLMIASNLLEIDSLIGSLKKCSIKMVLFGSRAAGTHRSGSDFDLFIIAEDKGKILRIINSSPLAERIQAVVKSVEEAILLEENEPILSAEIRKGITLWEK